MPDDFTPRELQEQGIHLDPTKKYKWTNQNGDDVLLEGGFLTWYEEIAD